MSRRPTPEFTRNRKTALTNYPICYWCNKAPSTEADHIVPYDAGGSDDEMNLVGACKPCNSKRGTIYVNQKRAIQQQRRNEALGLHKSENTRNFFVNEKQTPPTPFSV